MPSNTHTHTQPGRFYCDAFELFSVGPTNLPVDTSVRRYDDIDSIVDKPLTPSTPLRPWSLPRVTGAVTPPPPPPTVGLGMYVVPWCAIVVCQHTQIPQPTTTGTCSRMDNVVFMGNDMNDGCAVRRTADQCCQVCQATRNCKAWTSLKDNHPFCPGMHGVCIVCMWLYCVRTCRCIVCVWLCYVYVWLC